MKSILSTICIVLFSLSSFAQTTDFYKEKWSRVRLLELGDRLEDAGKTLDSIESQANKSQDKQQLIKIFLFRSKYSMVREENAEQRILSNLDALIKTATFPEQNIYQTIYAHLLYGYFQNNQYRIRDRTAGGVIDKSDFLTWDINLFYTELNNRYALALQHPEKLVLLPVKDYELLLDMAPQTRALQPSLLDIIALEAMTFYKSNDWYRVKPEETFKFHIDNVYLPTAAIKQLTAPDVDANNLELRVLQLYALLEDLHLKNGNIPAHIFNYKNRLEYGYQQTARNQVATSYETALQGLIERHSSNQEITMVHRTLADYYYNLSGSTATTESKAWRAKAIETATTGTTLFKESYGGMQCQLLLDQMLAPELSLQTENYAASKDNKRAVLSYRNVDQVQVRILRVPLNENYPENWKLKDSVYQRYIREAQLKNNLVFNEKIPLIDSEDTFNHTLSFNIPPLPVGRYLVQLLSDKQMEETVNYSFFDITDLTLLTENEENKITFTLLDRITGEPIKRKKIYVKNGEQRNGNEAITRKNSTLLKTNKLGEVSMRVSEKERNYNRYYSILAVNKKDSLLSSFANYNYRGYDNENSEPEMTVKPFIYLDRAIYRPGQTVYFKAVLAADLKGKSEIVPNYNLHVYVEDVNGQQIFETDLKTNDWGSINGSFTLPKDGLTGDFTIHVEDNEEADNKFSNASNWDDEYIFFQVEEYKRPRFKAELDAVTKTFKVNDNVTVTGKAQALLGSAITGATVKYTVNRTVSYARWRYGYINTTDKVITEGTTKTDNKGAYSIDFLAEPDDAINPDFKPIFNYEINVEITDVNGETRTASRSVRVGYHTLELQLTAGGILDLESNEIQVQTRNLSGENVPAQVKIEVKKQEQINRVIIPQVLPATEFYTMSDAAYKNLYPYAPEREPLTYDWKTAPVIYTTTQRIDSLTTIKLPIDKSWINGNYYLVATAVDLDQSLTDEKSQIIEKKNFEIWSNKEQPLRPSIVTTNLVSSDVQKAVVDFFTSMDEVTVYIRTWDAEKIQEELTVALKNGKTTLEFDMNKISGRTLNLSYVVQKENSFHNNKLGFSKPAEAVKAFEIETNSFRDLLKPGEQETWSFTIKNKDGFAMAAEALGSMYDASLDEFTTAYWYPMLFFTDNNTFYPSRIEERSNHIQRSMSIQMEYKPQYYNLSLTFERLDYFGLSFQNPTGFMRDYRNKIERQGITLEPKEGMVVGKVTDISGEGIFGATIQIKGSNTGVTTDFDGNYQLEVKGDEIIVFNATGYSKIEMELNSQSILNATLSASLGGVTLIGYRSALPLKSNTVASMVSGDDIVYSSNESVLQRLQGQVAGLNIITEKGQPGENYLIQLRGASSINGNTEPLIIIDGIAVNEDTFKGINPNNIKEVAILKDANATAIYGSRGANGVIIISTKEGVSTNDLVLQAMALNNVQARKNLDETAFFLPELYTDPEGNLSFTFTSPEALTQWKLRILAHDKQAQVAYLEKLVRTQKELNLVPNAPRFLRETDTIRFSTKIANLTPEKLSGLATLKLFDASTMQPVDAAFSNTNNVQNFEVDGKGNTSVNFTFIVPKGATAVTYRIIASSGTFSDGEESTLPVLTNRMLVNEARALWVRAGKTQSVTIDNLAKNTSTTLENHKLTFEYTSNPAWYAIKSLPYLMEFEHECSEQTFSRYYANSVASHILTSTPQVKAVFDRWAQNGTLKSNLEKNEELKTVILAHTPWLLDGQSETEQQQHLADLFDMARTAREKQRTLKILEDNQLASGAFPWWKGGNPSEYITRHIAAGIGHLAQLKVEDVDSLRSNTIYNKAIAYSDAEWTRKFTDYVNRNKKNKLSDYGFGVDYWHYLYARSFKSKPEKINMLLAARDYAFAKAEKEHASQPLYTKLLYAITLHRAGKTVAAKKILEGIKQTAVVNDESGMYWKENKNSWYWYASDIESHALAIEAFHEIANDQQTVEELKIWLLKNKRTKRWKSTKATADASYALLLQGGDWLSVQENNEILWGGEPIPEKLMATTTKEAGTSYFKVALNKEEITPKMATISVTNNSSVTGYGGLYWQYFEDLDQIKTDDAQPLSVKKTLFKKVNTPLGEQLVALTADEVLKIGDLVTIRIEIRSKADMDYVHLKDMRASGFEPVDVISKYQYQDGLGYYQSTKDVASHFFFDRLNKGTYVFEYEVRANNAGSFSNGITQLECMYAPEFASHSAGMRVTIEE